MKREVGRERELKAGRLHPVAKQATRAFYSSAQRGHGGRPMPFKR